jgi:hypothetical protein
MAKRAPTITAVPMPPNAGGGGKLGTPAPYVAKLVSPGVVSAPQNEPELPPHVTIDQPQTSATTGGNTTPRGKHKYFRMGRWKLYKILAVLAFVVAFLALIFVGILWRREANANHEFRSEMGKQMEALQLSISSSSSSERKRSVAAIDTHEDGGSIPFTLEADVGKYTRWPAMGGIEGLNFGALSETRLCCEDRQSKYFICDIGATTTLDVSLTSVVEYDRTTGDSFLRVLVNHPSMQGASCRFTWKNKNHHHHQRSHRRGH